MLAKEPSVKAQSSLTEVSEQESFSRGWMTQKKWWVMLGPQMEVRAMRIMWVSKWMWDSTQDAISSRRQHLGSRSWCNAVGYT